MSKYLDLELRQDVISILSPYMEKLKALRVDHIGYREFGYDGTSIAFCSYEGWYEVTLDECMSEYMSVHYAQELMSLNRNEFDYIIRTPTCVNNRFLQELLMRDMCNSLLIYRRERKMIRMYSFISYVSNTAALNYFFNKRYCFESAVDSYQDALACIFQKKKYQKLRKPLFTEKMVSNIFDQGWRMNVKNNNSCLTPRETECISLLVKGATDKDIASKFNISPRTASYHISNIRKKMKVSSRFGIAELTKTQLNF